MKKQFILGVGSQRAGSTSLWQLLKRHPKIKMHPVKELHYFDTLYGLRKERVLKILSKRSLSRSINDLCLAENFDFITPDWKWQIQTDLNLAFKPVQTISYLDLFAAGQNFKGAEFLGEATPEYMLLEAEALEKVKETVGDAFIIMMCRNPVKRIISSFRLLINSLKPPILPEERDKVFMDILTGDGEWVRQQKAFNDYKAAVERYRKVFTRVLPLSFDHIVDDPRRISGEVSRFLRIDFNSEKVEGLLKKRFNELKIEYAPDAEVMAHLERMFACQRQEAEELLGEGLIH